jgi:hypothetical protein
MNVTAVRFRLGPTGATTLAWFPLEQMDMQLTAELWFSEPVVYGPNQAMFIECISPVAVPANTERLGFGCYIVDCLGGAVS